MNRNDITKADGGREAAAPRIPRSAQKFAEALDFHVSVLDERDRALGDLEALRAQLDSAKHLIDQLVIERDRLRRERDEHMRAHMRLAAHFTAIRAQLDAIAVREAEAATAGAVDAVEAALGGFATKSEDS